MLRSLSIRYLEKYEGHDELEKLHGAAANYFLTIVSTPGEELIAKVECFFHLFREDPQKAFTYFESIYKFALDRGDRVISRALLNQIDFNYITGEIKGWYLLRLGGYFRQFRDFPKALDLFNQVINNAHFDQKLLAYALNNIGYCYLFFNPEKNYIEAIKLFKESNTICKKMGLADIYAMNLNNLGIAYGQIPNKNQKDAQNFYKRSLSITESKKYRKPLVAAMSYRNLACIYESDGKFPDGISLFRKKRSKIQGSREYSR